MPSQQPGSSREPHIYFSNAEEIAHWMRVLNCSETQLRAAVAAVGTHVPAIQRYLKLRKLFSEAP